jgi:fatty acid desaturase
MDEAVALRKRVLAEHRPEIRALHELNPLWNFKIVGLLLLWLVGLYVSLTWTPLPGVFLSTCGLLGMAILMHDSAHHLLARSSAWNRWLGFLCGAPALISATAYRYNHTTHHAVTGTDEDPGDLVGSAKRARLPLGRLVLIVLLLGTVLVIPDIARGGYRKADATGRRQILQEYALIAAGLLLALSLSPWPVLLYGWLLPFVFGSLANNLRSLAEHTFTDRTDSLRNARTMMGSRWVNFVQSNVNYHWEHHLFPGVPWYHLPALHRLLAPVRNEIAPPTAGGYLAWLWSEVLPRLQ